MENREKNQAGKLGKLHAKYAVIDDTAMIGNANLSDDAFDQNMELGAIVKAPVWVARIREHFKTLTRNGMLRRL